MTKVVQDLDGKIRGLSDLDRVSLIQELTRMGVAYQYQYRIGSRAEPGSMERYRGDEAHAYGERLRRIIYFLRFRTLAEDASAEDMKLCGELAETFQAKGQWTESYPISEEIGRALW
jgi:hypothetical protein